MMAMSVIPDGAGAAEQVVSDISVVDGDTLQIGNGVYNLFGIDAPELGQFCYQDGRWNHCGVTAAFELKKLLAFDKPLKCEPAIRNPHRIVCHADKVDVAIVLLKAGYAVAESESGTEYEEAEKSAREGNLGLWHMSFVSPWDWRHGRRLPGAAETMATAGCPIKGIAGAQGSRLYYVPTDAVYGKLRVDPERGDRTFCSDVEAREAGWHRPGEARRP
jgi:endonuclease YncB( thermonuclease family)